MPRPYTVQPGDHLARIAARFGFLDERTIWDDPANAAIRQARPNPQVLLPGDVVVIPDREVRVEEGQTERRHTFLVRRSRLRLLISVRDRFDVPQAGLTVPLAIDGEEQAAVTDGEGVVERAISPTSSTGRLSALGEDPVVQVGFLDPVESPTGWKARLNNLGYAAGPVGQASPLEERSAIEEFQCDFGLKISGAADGPTLQMLMKVHGC